jgi:formiminotetrahydrofolate cyclodeaminase
MKERVDVKLDELSICDFVDELSSSKATPGGGSVAALCGALGAALSAKVAGLTRGKEKFKDRWASMEEIKSITDLLRIHFLGLVQQDADSYQAVMASLKLPRETEQQKNSRQEAMQASLKKAAKVPMETLRASQGLMEMAQQAFEQGDPIAITDAGAAVHLAYAAGQIAASNVRINLSQIEDQGFRLECSREVEDKLARLKALFAEMEGYVDAQLKRGSGVRNK